MSFQISIHSKQSDIDLIYHEPIILDRQYEVALQTFVTYNSIPNVSNNLKNNVFHVTYNYENDQELHLIEIPDGAYEVDDIIDLLMKDHIVREAEIFLKLNKNTMKVEISCKKAAVDFTWSDSVGPLLGFSNHRYIVSGNTEKSDTVVDINPINTIRLQCNLIKCNFYDHAKNDNTIYEFPLDVNPGERIVERPTNLLYYTINTDAIHELAIRITDQSGKLIDFRGEQVTLILLFRPVK